ncbi:hypothetical protein R80B4_00374 [Fibrobacteres bacterium R8-0-B4]
MKAFTTKWRTLLVAAAVAVGAVCWTGCGEDIKGPDIYADPNDDGTLWNDWIVTTQPTCNAPGMETRTDARNPNHKET